VLASPGWLDKSVMIATVLGLLGSGALAARIGRASLPRGALRVAFWGVLAMLVSSLVGDWMGAD
jgi:VIT1/CCC1 family predicted Fe2+/Mn2+ transporter